ncbi:YihY/virulence factor BrkB family protein [Bacillus testis]|uniref:YihY/virulence factor BrkB family protein n=1 Tax=Bacillus testis TaxID=1622072 RepID=UPI00067ED3B0|nr:YihY/virulence factor BrkB family protein [Bacillus testis]
MNKVKIFVKELSKKTKEDRATGLAAEQSYYYTLSLFPMMILLLSIIPYLNLSTDQVISAMEKLLPGETTSMLKTTILDIIETRNGGLLTFGILGTIWSASNGMNAFIHSSNIAFEVKESRNFIVSRLISIGLTFGFIFAIIVVLVLPVFGNVLIDALSKIIDLSPETKLIFSIVRYTVAVVVMAAILSILYFVAPDKRYPFKHVIPGAAIATVVWLIISLGFSFYVSHFGNYSSTYGSLGGFIVLMLWLYLTGLVFVVGGEINALLFKHKVLKSKKDSTTTHYNQTMYSTES